MEELKPRARRRTEALLECLWFPVISMLTVTAMDQAFCKWPVKCWRQDPGITLPSIGRKKKMKEKTDNESQAFWKWDRNNRIPLYTMMTNLNIHIYSFSVFWDVFMKLLPCPGKRLIKTHLFYLRLFQILFPWAQCIWFQQTNMSQQVCLDNVNHWLCACWWQLPSTALSATQICSSSSQAQY